MGKKEKEKRKKTHWSQPILKITRLNCTSKKWKSSTIEYLGWLSTNFYFFWELPKF
jgi:hypothetical protein